MSDLQSFQGQIHAALRDIDLRAGVLRHVDGQEGQLGSDWRVRKLSIGISKSELAIGLQREIVLIDDR